MFIKLSNGKKMLEDVFFDSLHLERRSAFTQKVARQMIRVVNKDTEYLVSQVVKNLSLMVFVMIPVFALLLKLLYLRSQRLYIHHLIHTIHIHTFAFFIYGLALVLVYWYLDDGNIESWIIFGAVMIVGLYSYLSFRKVYQQNWKKTTLKYLFTGIFYSLLIFLALVIEVLISFLVF